ncbi:hypothetical protein Trichorick_01414 (plasmid) [Candidatus Trichorickettsia mobilis]|uniref:Uncharacterized protein n=1 Tax=Candidatus Trichorickettsia mobilis TaxID=1346319 RepID=A0ABZ0UV67_9RICK|nr:hypothetical protein [Candidatus Trichorickettsia mobilis]WPY01501.1 hypothetical protein Trichorick_01414 [Candidatus Trichorickettsia mobilis]
MKAQVLTLCKRTSQEKKAFRRYLEVGKNITRANDSTKTLGNKQANVLLATLIELLFREEDKTIFVDHKFLSEITLCSHNQNRNILNQLSDILNCKYRSCVKFKGERRSYGYVIAFTHDGEQRISTPELFYNMEVEREKLL